MDSERFDRVAKTLAQTGTRRGVVRLLAVLPVAGVLADRLAEDASAAGRRKRRKAKHRHQTGKHKDHRKGQRKGKRKGACATARQTPKQGTRKGCCPGLTTDASGRCAAPAAGPAPAACTDLQPTPSSPTQGLQEAIDAAADGGRV